MDQGLSIIICTHNRAALLQRTLESLSLLKLMPPVALEVIVVANACTDSTRDTIAGWTGRLPGTLRCVDEPTPGLSVARNRGVAEARHGLIAFLDDDVWVCPGWLAALIDVFATTRAGMVAGRVELWWEEVQRPDWLTRGMEDVLSALDRGPSVKELFPPDIVGANFSCRRQVLDDAGLFRTDLGRVGTSLGAGEESEFVRRALAAGHRLFYCPGASVKHWVPARRIEMEYLMAASRSVARTIVQLSQPLSFVARARTLAIGITRYAGHGAVAAIAGVLGLDSRRRRSLIRHAIGAGQIEGVLGRH